MYPIFWTAKKPVQRLCGMFQIKIIISHKLQNEDRPIQVMFFSNCDIINYNFAEKKNYHRKKG